MRNNSLRREIHLGLFSVHGNCHRLLSPLGPEDPSQFMELNVWRTVMLMTRGISTFWAWALASSHLSRLAAKAYSWRTVHINITQHDFFTKGFHELVECSWLYSECILSVDPTRRGNQNKSISPYNHDLCKLYIWGWKSTLCRVKMHYFYILIELSKPGELGLDVIAKHCKLLPVKLSSFKGYFISSTVT